VFEVVVDVNGNIVDTYTSSATVLSSLNFTVNSKFDTTTGKRTWEAEAGGLEDSVIDGDPLVAII
jgi:hypothetical protein